MAYKTYDYSKHGLEATQRKDMRIAWLSVFSSLCKAEIDFSLEKITEKTYEIVEELYQTFPFPDKEEDEKAKKAKEKVESKPPFGQNSE